MEWLKILADKATDLHGTLSAPPVLGMGKAADLANRSVAADQLKNLRDDMRALHKSVLGRDAWR